MPSLPTVNNRFWSSSSTSSRSNTMSRSSDSAGACWKCQASLPVSTSSASVELVKSASSLIDMPRLIGIQGFACAVPQ